MVLTNSSLMDKLSNFIKIYESLDWFGSEIRYRIRIIIENWKKTSASYRNIHLVICKTNSHCSLQTLLLWTKFPILLKYMNLWNDSDRKWGLESESKSKIERKPLHHKDIPDLVNGDNNSHCSLQTLLLWTKYPILFKYMNLWTDSDRKWGLESES